MSSQPEANAGKGAGCEAAQLIGRIINGKYEVQSILGEGGMGIVYKVRHLILQHKTAFALKILHPRLCAQSDFQSRFLREVEIAMELTHENIVQIRDFGLTEQGLLFYTMDFFPGASLKDILEKDGPMAPERVARIARQILLALGEAHKSGIIHRDLKPDNLLIERADEHRDEVRILDFGIAKVLLGDVAGPQENLTQGNAIGTPKYMSPEQAGGESVDNRSDLYSLGCILYEMLCGHPPFTGRTARTLLLAHLTTPPPPLRDRRPRISVPAPLERLVFQLLAKKADERPASAAAVLELLDGSGNGAIDGAINGGDAGRPQPPGSELRPVRPRWRRLAAAAALAVLGAGLGLLLPSWRGTGGKTEAVEPKAVQPTAARSSTPVVLLRCNVCGATYARGQKVGEMCHGEPLQEVAR